jgi:hypothetical protein
MPYFDDPHRVDLAGHRRPGEVVEPSRAAFTIAGRNVDQPEASPLPKAETTAQLAFQGYQLAVDAQRDLNRQVDAEFNKGRAENRNTITEEGVRQRKGEIRNSPVAREVELGEAAVAAREREARERYDALVAGMVQPGDAAEEARRTRYLAVVERKMTAAGTDGRQAATVQELIREADPSQRSLLLEQLPSMFTGTNDIDIQPVIDAVLREVDPELATAAEDVRRSAQVSAMSKVAAGWVRDGFQTGCPPTQVGKLAEAVSKYDPDQPR